MGISAITLQKIQQNEKDHDGKYEKLRRKYENTISVKCPTCNNYFEVDVFRAYSMGVPFNCPHCNSILRIRKKS